MTTTKTSDLIAVAEQAAATFETWSDLSNFLFDPLDGLVAKAYPTAEARAQFVKTGAYKKLRTLVEQLQDKSGLVEGAKPKKSGKFVVRLPTSLHAALEREATTEGVSLNQLVVAKLAVQLEQLGKDPLGAVIRAFAEVRDGYSVDRVVADPDLNRRFLARCRQLGAVGTDFDLNHTLFYARKNNKLSHLPKTRRYTPRNSDDYEYASEIAVRYLQRQQLAQEERRVSLDHILCDPALAAIFDGVASKLAPGFTPLEYRWAALGLRKASRFSEAAREVKLPEFEDVGRTKSIRASRLPTAQGIYVFREESGAIFAGETDNLRQRIERHLEYGGLSGVPQWLYEAKSSVVGLGIVPMPNVTLSQRKIVELGVVSSLRPVLNYWKTRLEAA
jgi:predicted HicB family RNase H-like nuclease